MSWGYPEYVPIAKKIENAQKVLQKLQKKNPNISPVVIEGKKIAETWWGLAWNKNLESYADFDSRIGRGRSYVKNGFVLDLQIQPGLVTSIVAGSEKLPYEISIEIDILSASKWDYLTKQCGRSIDSMDQLLQGKFPKGLENLFTQKGDGLFPTPKELKFSCSCYDWASMCKHVAATLYGVGARLDKDPTLFFKLRGIEIEALLKKSIEEKMAALLKNSGKKTTRVIKNADLGKLFGL